MDIKENCAKEHTWARKRKNAQLLGKVRVLLSQSVEVYKLRRHLQWKGRDEWVACRAGQLIQRPVGVVEEKCLGKESIGPSDAVRSGSDTIRSIRHDEPADGRGTDKTEKKKSERAIWRHEKTSPVRVGPRSASNSSWVCDAQVEEQLISVRQVQSTTFKQNGEPNMWAQSVRRKVWEGSLQWHWEQWDEKMAWNTMGKSNVGQWTVVHLCVMTSTCPLKICLLNKSDLVRKLPSLLVLSTEWF